MLLSLDVGFKSTGWAVFHKGLPVACGCIHTDKAKSKSVRTSDDRAVRAAIIALGLKEIVEKYKVKGVVGEMPSGGSKSATAMAMMAAATGIVSATFAVLNIPAEWTTPNEVKLAACGMRSVTKDQVMEAMIKCYPDTIFPKNKAEREHAADACAAYLASKGGVLVKLYG